MSNRANYIEWTRRARLVRALPKLVETRKQLINLCKLSEPTFSRAVNGDGRVTERTFRKIEDAILALAREREAKIRQLGERVRKPEFITDVSRAWKDMEGRDCFNRLEVMDGPLAMAHAEEPYPLWMHMHGEPAWSDARQRFYAMVLARKRCANDQGGIPYFQWALPLAIRSNVSWPKVIAPPPALADYLRRTVKPEVVAEQKGPFGDWRDLVQKRGD